MFEAVKNWCHMPLFLAPLSFGRHAFATKVSATVVYHRGFRYAVLGLSLTNIISMDDALVIDRKRHL